MANLPDFSVQNNFPIASVIDAAQRNAQLQEQARQYGQKQLLDGLQSIGQIGQSLLDRRRGMAQALTLGHQLGMDPSQIQGLMPDQVIDAAKIKAEQIDLPAFMQGLSVINGGSPTAGTATPAATPQGTPSPADAAPTAQAGTAPVAGGMSVPTMAPTTTSKTAHMLLTLAAQSKQAKQFQQKQTQENEHFDIAQKQRLADKKEGIEKEYQDRNKALDNAIAAVNTSLDLKRKATQGPISGAAASIVGNATSGAFGNHTYQLVKHNLNSAPLMQHSQEVNRFNPLEVQALNTSSFSQPGEPMKTSEEKASRVLKILQDRKSRNESEKSAELSALGIPQAPSPAVVAPPPPPSDLVHLSTKELMDLRNKISSSKTNGNQPK